MKMLVVVMLMMVVVPQAVVAGFSRKGKNRMMLKSLLYDYTHSRVQSEKMMPRQCGPATGTVCCQLDEATKPSDCEYDTASLFENSKKALLFQINQLDSFDNKFNRLKKSITVIKNKSGKQNEFTNTTALLLRAIGGDKASPQCAGQSTQTKSLRDAVTTLEELGNCSAMIDQACLVNETVQQINMTVFDYCDQKRVELVNQIEISFDEEDATAKCLYWKEAARMVDELRSEKVMNGLNCLSALDTAARATNPTSKKGLKGRCLAEFIICKKAQDRAISLINACNDEATVLVGNFRSMLDELEDDEESDDYEDDYGDDSSWLHDFD